MMFCVVFKDPCETCEDEDFCYQWWWVHDHPEAVKDGHFTRNGYRNFIKDALANLVSRPFVYDDGTTVPCRKLCNAHVSKFTWKQLHNLLDGMFSYDELAQ